MAMYSPRGYQTNAVQSVPDSVPICVSLPDVGIEMSIRGSCPSTSTRGLITICSVSLGVSVRVYSLAALVSIALPGFLV